VDLRYPLRVVTPTLDGDVLIVLARANAEFPVARSIGPWGTRRIRASVGSSRGSSTSEQIMTLQGRASAWTGNDARVLEYSESELPRLRRGEPVIRDIAAEGIVLNGDVKILRTARRSQR
jgi:hypothetical protein